MPRPERRATTKSVKGAQELVRLWNSLPLRRISIPVARLPPSGLAELNDRLRHRCWREVCARRTQPQDPMAPACADLSDEPHCLLPRDCTAHALFPTDGADPDTGERFSRNSLLPTLHCRWQPQRRELVLWLLGPPALMAETLALREIESWLGRPPIPTPAHGTLHTLLPAEAGEYRNDLVTPWILSPGNPATKDLAATFHDSLRNGLIAHARKQTNTCVLQLQDAAQRRLGIRMLLGFAAEYIVRDMLAAKDSLKITDDGITLCGSDRQEFQTDDRELPTPGGPGGVGHR